MKNALAPLIIGLLLLFSACEDFIEKDISGDSISILAPPNNLQTSIVTQTFWWNELEGAEEYNIQIVKGTFNFIEQFITDTSVTSNSLTYTLQPGSFQWRIRGQNNGYFTEYTTYNLFIDSTLDLTNQQVLLLEPLNNLISNQTDFTFKWTPLYNAEEYRFQLIDSISGSNLVDVTISASEYDYSLTEGSYIWQVRAINSGSITAASKRNLFVDLTAPGTPVLLSPGYDAMLNFGANDSLIWSSGANSVGDSLFISNDSTFVVSDKYYTNLSFYILTQQPGTYFWRVKSIDGANNESSFSMYRKFYIQ